MTPEHKALVEALTRKAETDGLLSVEDIRSVAESLSAQSAQPQTCEPGKPAAFIQKEVLDALLKDKSATGTVSSGLLRKPFGNPVALYTSPQPANPAQVTDAMVEVATKELLAHGEFSSIPGNNEPNARIAARAVITTAIGAESEEDTESQWRDLALQFDSHRIQAMCLLRAIAADKAGKAEIEAFLSAPPLSGEQVLTDRIASIGAGGQAVASLDDVAARLWKADAEDSGSPASVADGRTREAFDDQAEEVKARWRKFAKAASSALSQPHPADERVVEALDDTKRFDKLRNESWDLRCFDIPTGGDDYDIGWRVVGHWMADPRERTIAEVYHDDPRAAIDKAISSFSKSEGRS